MYKIYNIYITIIKASTGCIWELIGLIDKL